MKFMIVVVIFCFTYCNADELEQQSACEITPKIQDAICSIEGNYTKTFDGLSLEYNICDHILANNLNASQWNIIATTFCNETLCYKDIEINNGGIPLKINSFDFLIQYNGYTYTIAQGYVIGTLLGEFEIHPNGDGVYFKSVLYGFWVQLEKDGDIFIGVPKDMWNKVNGLCGIYNGIPEDDTTKPDGTFVTSTKEFGDSWRVPGSNNVCRNETCSFHQDARDLCKSVVTSEDLKACADVISFEFCFNSCVQDVCSCLEQGGNENDCRCQAMQNYVKQCHIQAPDLDLSSWRDENNCPAADCPSGMVYKDCYKQQCEPSCENLYFKNASCPTVDTICHSGCFCSHGLVKKGDKCVRPEKCKDCICEGWGDPHYTTFDGTIYSFQGPYSYIAVRNKDSYPDTEFHVFVTNNICGKQVTCPEAITITYNNHIIQVSFTNGTSLYTAVDGRPITHFPMNDTWVQLETVINRHVTVFIPNIYLEVTLFYSWKFVIRLSSHSFSTSIEGLCGNCNKEQLDDLTTSYGNLTTDVDEFGKSWAVKYNKQDPAGETFKSYMTTLVKESETCENIISDQCSKIFNNTIFGQCHPLVDPAPYVESCEFDLCYGDDRFATESCKALESYAQACQMKGVCLNWRRDHLCPYVCPSDKVYKPCGSACQLTCHNYKAYDNNASLCALDATEGCFCPNGYVTKGDICVKRENCTNCICESWSGSHFVSFDNKHFSFSGACMFLFARDKVFHEEHVFQVQIATKPCNNGSSCIVSVTILYENETIFIFRDDVKQKIRVKLNDNEVISLNITNGIIIKREPKVSATVIIPQRHMLVQYVLESYKLTLNVSSESFANDLFEGLCGNCNGEQSDDFRMSDGNLTTDATEFGNSWFVKNPPPGIHYDGKCERFPDKETCLPIENQLFNLLSVRNPCTVILDKDVFGECHYVKDPYEYYQACSYKECHTEKACTIIQSYADACRERGICVDWRSRTVCPYHCASGTLYKPCNSGCVQTCDNTNPYQLQQDDDACGFEQQVEGCFCPDGLVLYESVCIPRDACEYCEPPACSLVPVPENETVGLISELDDVHGTCVNKKPIHSFKTCSGYCKSDTYYNAESSSIVLEGKCCTAVTTTWVSFFMTCGDNFQYRKEILVPSSCSCRPISDQFPYDLLRTQMKHQDLYPKGISIMPING